MCSIGDWRGEAALHTGTRRGPAHLLGGGSAGCALPDFARRGSHTYRNFAIDFTRFHHTLLIPPIHVWQPTKSFSVVEYKCRLTTRVGAHYKLRNKVCLSMLLDEAFDFLHPPWPSRKTRLPPMLCSLNLVRGRNFLAPCQLWLQNSLRTFWYSAQSRVH